MTTFETITVERDERGVATLNLTRPEKHNAMNAAMIRELHTAALELGRDEAVRVVVLAAEGKSFCAGGDLGWMREQFDKPRAGRTEEALVLAEMLQELDRLPKPLIARVQGAAYGGGIGLMSVCDIAIVARSAKFVLSETRLGLIPATIGPFVVRAMGERAARALFMNSKPFDCETALSIGLATHVVDDENLDDVVAAEVNHFLQCAPGAVADAKALCLHLARSPAEGQMDWTVERLAERWESTEAHAGITAFFAREKPPWQD